jgi:type 2 lantibiotic biosynthesis protein LanM
MPLSLRFPKEFLGISPGFYMAHGNAALSDDDSQDIVRLYFNLTADGALSLMKQASLLLNQAQLPFNLKVINDPQSYSRCDSVVLYIRKSDYGHVATIVREIYRDISVHLKQRTPAFTKALAPGVGLAEEPGQDSSFGEHRCRLLADGIIRAHEQRKKSLNERIRIVVERFAEDGIDLEMPFLNPGSADDYHFTPPARVKRPGSYGISSQLDFDRSEFLATAEAIASGLSRDAIWQGDRCNWLGAEPVDLTRTDQQSKLSYRALGPNLYDGTSGVALFLAELHAATGDVTARRTALGAVRQALSRVDSLPVSQHIGLYTGAVGIAFAAARVGSLLAEEQLLDNAAKLLRNLSYEEYQGREFDLIAGTAGAIVALVILRHKLNDKSLLDYAVRLADNLLERAVKADAGYSWTSTASSRQPNLTGFSHGTAGVGYALLELFQATGETRYRSGAEGAFNYERHWFDHNAGNWPDFREEVGRGRRIKVPLSFASLWCHGAPGIALSRLRAFQLLGDDMYKAEAITALETTRKTIRNWLHSGTENYSLCHGLAGNAETLIYGCDVLGDEVVEDRNLVAEVANAGIERYAKHGGPWPCGGGAEETPSLMPGLAGIGYFYLRLHTPKIPSILILQPDTYPQ